MQGSAENAAAATARAAYFDWVKKFPKYKLEQEPDGEKDTKENVVSAINEKITANAKNPGSPAELLADYEGLQAEGAIAFEQARNSTFRDLQNQMSQAGFDYIPTPFWGRWEKEHLPAWTNWCVLHFVPRYFFHIFWHLLGILATVGLLALGAPFWFNLLKNLTSLRPAVANLIEKRPTSAPALPPAPASPPSPS